MSHQTHFGNSVLAPRSKFYQGPFGRICPNLEPWAPPGTVKEQDAFFEEFARKNMVELPGVAPADIAEDENTINDLESKFGSQIPAGYTYFGQFIDHDITLDITSIATRQIDPDRIMNFRTPRLDLECRRMGHRSRTKGARNRRRRPLAGQPGYRGRFRAGSECQSRRLAAVGVGW